MIRRETEIIYRADNYNNKYLLKKYDSVEQKKVEQKNSLKH